MAYENLLKSVEESAQERERDLREKARSEVQAISEETKNQTAALKQSLLEEAKRAVTVEKNKRIYLTKGENKEKLIKTKERIFSLAFAEAEQRLSQIRKDPGYPAILKNLTREAVGALGGEKVLVHIDKLDEHLIKGILSDLNSAGEVIPDLHSAGGLVVSTTNESVKISNTIETRLERAKEQKKLQIYAVLYGV
ncbi:MAG TPA: V-type ATP synthase subunit E family protein [Methanoregula sp.]|nr:V-type ATP synthase subunit E family protein [Methanoregula sp.]